jgi:succinate dehydrogenase/fumarate reductase iron-sulfur protein
MGGSGIVRIFRFDPGKDKKPRFQTFKGVPYAGMRVTDVLNYIYQNLDQSLAFRYSCRAGLCGVCLLKVNGKACLSCHRIAEKEMTIEPPSRYVVIKDLVVDFLNKKGKQRQTEEE